MLVCFDDVTPFGIVTDEITPLGVRQTNLLLLSYQRQLLLLVGSDDSPLMCEASIPLLLCRVWLFLLDSSELAFLSLMFSLLDVSVD
jgi:hypothetical protein